MTDKIQSMGAHFSALIENRKNPSPGNYSYESARSALYSLITTIAPRRIHIPNYICGAIPETIEATGASCIKYPINQKFGIAGELDVQNGDLVLLVNYFGLSGPAIKDDLDRLPRSSVIVDCSQAYFSESFDCLATFYSPRKFLPVPDGGFINTAIDLQCESPEDEISIRRYEYLLRRVIGEPELSREIYLAAEESLSQLSLKKMSSFSRTIINSVDLDFIRQKRRNNFMKLSSLSSINDLSITIDDQVPLCYPLMLKNGAHLREYLIAERVFTPKYWPNVNALNDLEQSLIDNVVHLPIDHRYGEAHMNHLISLVKNYSERVTK